MITAKQINLLIKEAIKNFGEYNYFDKGSQEVMNLQFIYNKMSKMKAKEVADVLAEVKRTNKKYGEEFVRSMLFCLQDVDNFDDLYEDKKLKGLF
jgi:hypothetical protein